MRPAFTAITALLAASVALAGCGGEVDRKAYIRDVTNVQQRTTGDAAVRSEAMLKATTPVAIGDQLRELGSSIETNAGALGKIEAPDEVEDLHKRYVERLQRFGRDLEVLSGDVKQADTKTARQLLQRAARLTASLASDEAKLIQDINDGLR